MNELMQFLGGATLIIGALVYIAKKVVDGFLQSGVATFKANLEKVATENLIKFERLHHERANVVRELYQHLTKLALALSSTLNQGLGAGEKPLPEKVDNLGKLYDKFNGFYQLNKVFFSTDICEKIDNFIKSFWNVYTDITTYKVDIQSAEYKDDRELLKERHDFWEKARKLHENEMSEIRNEIERDFRNLLGVDS